MVSIFFIQPMNFEFIPQSVPAVILVVPKIYGDERGFFMESYQKDAFASGGITADFTQDNHSRSTKGVLRGLHFQRPPHAQGKLLRCIRGEIFDVAVDIRRESATFGKWVGVVLNEENKQMLYIPEGFAHGFAVLSETADVQYKATDIYHPELEGGLRWDDPEIGIIWPITNPLLSAKDGAWEGIGSLEKIF